MFRQPDINAQALDKDFDRVGSKSPLKYRPRIDMEGLQEEDYYQRKNAYDGRRLKTPDGNEMMTPKRSANSLGRNGTHRSNSKRSILKSAKSNKTLEFVSPQGPYSKVSFADVRMNN